MSDTKKNVSEIRIPDDNESQYLVASRGGISAGNLGIQPLSVNLLNNIVGSLPGVKVTRVIRPKNGLGVFAAAAGANIPAEEVYVTQIDEQQAQLLQQNTPPNIVIERDSYLRYSVSSQLIDMAALNGWNSKITPKNIKIRIVGENDAPLVDASVTLQGDGFPDQGITNDQGMVNLNLYSIGNRPAQSLFVVPHNNYWNRIIHQPPLSETEVNVVRVKSLRETMNNFPEEYKYGWGAKLMGLDKLDKRLAGRGVKIAIIDSGADNNHPLLGHIKYGVDFTDPNNPGGWNNDIVGHGTHCAGTISAFSPNNSFLRGFAPEAEIHIFKIFPGGQFSTLVDALNECIARGIDIVNMSLGSPDPSIIISQVIEKCVLNGIACIVAAGNSGGNIQFPAIDSNVLSVAAIGNINEVPTYTWDYETVIKNLMTQEGIFSPNFTCFGDKLGVCAPGVGIISTAPGGTYEPESGTSMAAPHITGVAALILAHHPSFKTTFTQRSAERVAVLFNLIKSLCKPVPFPNRSGAGIPILHELNQLVNPDPDTKRSSAVSSQEIPLGMLGATVGPYSYQPHQYTQPNILTEMLLRALVNR